MAKITIANITWVLKMDMGEDEDEDDQQADLHQGGQSLQDRLENNLKT